MADTKEIQECPICNYEMMKYFVDEINANVDICLHCGGVYLDIYESQLLDKASTETKKDVTSVLEYFKQNPRICPKCNAHMTKYESNNILIHECPECGVKFFNGGELNEFLNRFNTPEDKNNFIKDVLKIKDPS